MSSHGSAMAATRVQRPVRVAEPLLAHLRSSFGDDVFYVAPPQPLDGLWQYTVRGLPAAVPSHQVVRLVGDPTSLATETIIMGAVARSGVPAPQIVIDGRDFLAMAFVEGRALDQGGSGRRGSLADRIRRGADRRSASVVGSLLADLHGIDPQPVAVALAAAGADEAVGLDRPLRLLENNLATAGEPTLLTAYERLLAKRPVADGQVAVCHGGLGFGSVLERDGRVTGITGWHSSVIADRSFDVGATLAEFRLDTALTGDPKRVAAFLRVYGECVEVDHDACAWFESLHCLRAIVRCHLVSAGEPAPLTMTSLRSAAECVTTHTGIDLYLPR